MQLKTYFYFEMDLYFTIQDRFLPFKCIRYSGKAFGRKRFHGRVFSARSATGHENGDFQRNI
jgi:hypothetical protein